MTKKVAQLLLAAFTWIQVIQFISQTLRIIYCGNLTYLHVQKMIIQGLSLI